VYTPIFEQDRQCTYNVILRRIRATIAAVEKQLSITYSECMFVDQYPAMLNAEVYEFHENPSNGSRVVPCGRTDRQTGRHDKGNSRFSQF